jgi:ketosteroid isomerase-like protein
MNIEELARQVAEQSDRVAVLEVVASYATALDTKNWSLLETLFAPDATVSFGSSVGSAQGPAAIASLLRSTLERLDGSQHLVANSVVRLAGDIAEHTCYVQGQHIRRGAPGGELYLVAGRYDDQFRRTADGWRFTSRTITRSWSDGNWGVVHGGTRESSNPTAET